VILDVYGGERHPEYTEGAHRDEETYAGRRERAQLMLKTYDYVPDGKVEPNRHILIDTNATDPKLREEWGAYGTFVTQSLGGAPQESILVDLEGRVVQFNVWQRPEQNDEVLSAIFGLEPGL